MSTRLGEQLSRGLQHSAGDPTRFPDASWLNPSFKLIDLRSRIEAVEEFVVRALMI